MGEDIYGLLGKRVIITGASRGLGQVCAEVFSKEGAKLLLAARSQEKLERVRSSLQHIKEHEIFSGDLTKLENIQRLVDTAEEFGEIDIVLHIMGGGLGMRSSLLEWEEFGALFKTNLAVAAEINRLIIPGMIKRETGNIVHVGSIAGVEAAGSVGYNSVKAALAAYIRSLGRELAVTGVVVTGILPGGFWAPDNSWMRFKERDPKKFEEVIAERQPRRQLCNVQELMPILLLLASRRATMMTGCCVPIDGGEGVTYVQ
jgi:3-oxoacyl-[acyl-carrier protein] reductase